MPSLLRLSANDMRRRGQALVASLQSSCDNRVMTDSKIQPRRARLALTSLVISSFGIILFSIAFLNNGATLCFVGFSSCILGAILGTIAWLRCPQNPSLANNYRIALFALIMGFICVTVIVAVVSGPVVD